MKSRITSLGVFFILAISVGVMTSCSHQGANRGMHSFGTDRPTVNALHEKGHKTFGKDGNGNQTCTYYHKGSNGSMWKTKWC